MDLQEMLALMAAPIYARIRRNDDLPIDPDARKNVLESQMLEAVKEAKMLWKVVIENKSFYD